MAPSNALDLTPLLEVPALQKLYVDLANPTLPKLKQHPGLRIIALTPKPERPVAEFWKEYDAKQAAGKK